MIAVRKVEERQRERASMRLSAADAADTQPTLRLHDLWLPPGERIELDGQRAFELITYVVTGTIAHASGSQTTALISAGEFQRTAVGMEHDVAHTQTNPSLSETSHVVQLILKEPSVVQPQRQELRRFSLAQRRGLLCAVAAREAATGLLSLSSEIALYSSVLDPGQHLVHGFAAAHSGLLHVVSGELNVAGYVLGTGDTALALGERSLAFTARDHAEVLLGDVRGIASF